MVLLALGCELRSGQPAGRGSRNVLVVINTDSPDSVAVGSYYVAKRKIAPELVCRIKCPTDELILDEVCRKTIRDPIRKYVVEKKLRDRIDYIVLTKGIPIRTAQRWGVDSSLVCLFQDADTQMNNPYFGSRQRFSHADFGMYLVTRLDGLTLADAKALVDRSLAAKPEKGLFLLDMDPARDNPGYKFVNDYMRRAESLLQSKQLSVELNETSEFVVRTGLMGYFGWGSNDNKYNLQDFRKLRFRPGSLAELGYSASAITINGKHHWKEDESNIAHLVAQGVTGVKGYVQEPFASAIAAADIMFDRYTSGYNLAESFYAASRFVHWRDIILGDPLCAPYAEKE